MPNHCHVTLAGHLTRDPELRYTPGGHAVCDIGVAYNNKRSKQEEVSFFEVTLWRSSAEAVAEYLSKGDAILVYGRLKQDRWETDNGQKRSKVKIVADGFEFVGGGSGGRKADNNRQTRTARGTPDVDEEEIPF